MHFALGELVLLVIVNLQLMLSAINNNILLPSQPAPNSIPETSSRYCNIVIVMEH